jgi:DNA-binding CsgD family transcriptional regulator
LKGAEEETQRYYRNVGNYANSIGTLLEQNIPQMQSLKMVWNNVNSVLADARKQMAATVTTFNAATTATARMSAGLKMLKIALVSTGIGAIVVALGSLVSYLTRTQKGVELARKAMAGISATIDVLLDRIAMLGSSIVSLFKGDFVDAANTAKAAFQGIGKEIREETNTAMALSDAMQDIEKREIALSAQMAASKVQLAELKRIADDTTRSYKEREDAAQQALNIEVGLAAKAKQLGQERIANMLGDASKLEKALSYLSQGKGSDWIIDNLGLSASTVKDYQGLVDAFNAYQQQVLEFTEKQVEGNNKLNSIRKERIATEKAAMEEMLAIEKELDDEIAKMGDAYQKQIEREWQLRLETIVKGSEEEYNIRAEQLRKQRDMELAEEGTTYEMRKLIWEKYNQDMRALQSERDAQEMEQMRLTWNNKIAEAQLQGQNTLQLELERRKAELDALHQMEGENEAQFLARQLEAKQAYADAQKKISDFEVTVEQTKAEAIANITNGLGQIFEAFAEDNKAMAMASKVLALAEIAINTGKAIAAGVASASGVPFPGNIAAIGSTVATVLGNIASATKTIKAAKFASGGYVSGKGSGTSDDVPGWLSNGESVNTALTTAMFSPLLSAVNQMGGGAPIIPRSASEVGSITEGEEMLARAVAKGVSALHPVVSVEEINRVSDRVAFVKTLGDV